MPSRLAALASYRSGDISLRAGALGGHALRRRVIIDACRRRRHGEFNARAFSFGEAGAGAAFCCRRRVAAFARLGAANYHQAALRDCRG